jgi:AAA+ superfamily predicted ATPase
VTSKNSKTENLGQEIAVHCAARYPVLSIETIEEKRALAAIHQAAQILKRYVIVWSVTDGITCEDLWTPGKEAEPKDAADDPITDPGEALEWLMGECGSGRTVNDDFLFVMLDPHPYLDAEKINVSYVRRMRDLVRVIKATPSAPSKGRGGKVIPPPPKRNVVLVAPEFKLPTGLIESVQKLELRLPTLEMLDSALAALEPGLPPEVRPSAEEREQILKAGLGLTSDGFSDVLAKSLAGQRKLDPAIISLEKEQVVARSGLAQWINPKFSIADVGGLEVLKGWLELRKLGFTDAALKYGLKPPKGILMGGIPGTGKSLCSQVVSTYLQLPLLRAGQLKGSFVGESEKNTERFLALVESVAPCVVWIDEAEKMFAGVGQGGATDGGVSDNLLGLWLTWMQEQSGVFMVMTANNVEALPSELLRKGRLDELFFLDRPNGAERRAIWEVKIKAKRRDVGAFDLDELVTASAEMTGAEIETVLESAMFSAFSNGVEVSQAHVVEELGQVIPLAVTMAKKLDAMRKFCDGKLRPASLADNEDLADVLGLDDAGRLAGIL